MTQHDEQHEIPAEYRWLLDEPADRVAAMLPGQVGELIELIGLEPTLKIISYYQGQQIYIPKLDGAFRVIRDNRIRSEFNGLNHSALAKRYGLSTSYIYRVISSVPDERQATLFGGGDEDQ